MFISIKIRITSWNMSKMKWNKLDLTLVIERSSMDAKKVFAHFYSSSVFQHCFVDDVSLIKNYHLENSLAQVKNSAYKSYGWYKIWREKFIAHRNFQRCLYQVRQLNACKIVNTIIADCTSYKLHNVKMLTKRPNILGFSLAVGQVKHWLYSAYRI